MYEQFSFQHVTKSYAVFIRSTGHQQSVTAFHQFVVKSFFFCLSLSSSVTCETCCTPGGRTSNRSIVTNASEKTCYMMYLFLAVPLTTYRMETEFESDLRSADIASVILREIFLQVDQLLIISTVLLCTANELSVF